MQESLNLGSGVNASYQTIYAALFPLMEVGNEDHQAFVRCLFSLFIENDEDGLGEELKPIIVKATLSLLKESTDFTRKLKELFPPQLTQLLDKNALSHSPDKDKSVDAIVTETLPNIPTGMTTISRSRSFDVFTAFVDDPDGCQEASDDHFFKFSANVEPNADASLDLPLDLVAELKVLEKQLSAQQTPIQSETLKESPREHESPRDRTLPKRLSAVMSFDPILDVSQSGSPRERKSSPISGSPVRSQAPVSPREVESPRSPSPARFFQSGPPRELHNPKSRSSLRSQQSTSPQESVHSPTKSSALPINQSKSRLRRSSLPVAKTIEWARHHPEPSDKDVLATSEVKSQTL